MAALYGFPVLSLILLHCPDVAIKLGGCVLLGGFGGFHFPDEDVVVEVYDDICESILGLACSAIRRGCLVFGSSKIFVGVDRCCWRSVEQDELAQERVAGPA
ncbi:hypothetical protein, partial [Streptomyces sp. NPDC046909]|uniref:hypothetical protein n=1 Tax=Streptomyces sp. NPDC046909 TaxID=3155617 RepID=UPI0033C11D4D